MPNDDGIGGNRQQIAAELRRVREQLGLSQEQMAMRLGMVYAPGGRKVSTGRAAVSAWERGRRAPSAQQLQTYVDLGGDPGILTGQPESLLEPRAEPAIRTGAAGDAESPRNRRPWWGRRVLWIPVAAVVVVAVVLVVVLRRPSDGPSSTWAETTGTPAHTWADPMQLTGAGQPLGPRQSVQVLCRVRGYIVQDGDPWWYRLASAPWNGRYYATSDAFYNNGDVNGPVVNGVVVDEQVPVCVRR